MSDHTRGEIKHVRGSGPPILTVEGNAVEIEQIVYAVMASSWHPQTPQTAQVIGIDLTRRTVRLQVIGGREILYSATGNQEGRDGNYWLFSTADAARANAVRLWEAAVKRSEDAADKAIIKLEEDKAKLNDVRSWHPRQFEDDCDLE